MPGKEASPRRRRGELEARQLERGKRGARVEQVVATRDLQVERGARVALAEGQHPLPAGQAGHAAVARQDQAPRRLAERPEGLEQLGARGPARVVVELDVGHHGHLGPQAQEARVGLVRLRHHPFAGAPAGVPRPAVLPRPRQLAAEQEARVGADRAKGVDEHPGGRRLAVGPGDSQKALLGAQLGEQLAAMDHRLAALSGSRELGVVLADGGRYHHLGVRRDGVGVVAHARLEAGRPQALEV